MKKKILSVFVTVAVVITGLAGFSSVMANDDISVTLNGTKIDFDVKPQIVDGRTVVPLRKIFEEIGALVKWDGETQTVSARKNSKTITMTICSTNMQINKGDTDDEGNAVIENVSLDVPAQVIDDRTLVPARAISEAFGLNVDWDDDTNTVIITDDDVNDDTWKENTGTINLTDLTYTGDGIDIIDNQIMITAGGDFTITGTLDDGNITVKTNDKVKLRLSGASITSRTNPCIYIKEADKAYITITDGTENSLTALDSESNALYSKENLELKGDGALNITAKGGHAIKASDNMTIENGVLNLISENDGIHINDTFKMTGGTINISAIGDGIDSESIVIINGGELNIETKGTPIQTETTTESVQGNRFAPFENKTDVEFEKSSKGINAEWMMVISNGEININSASHAIHCQDEIEITGGIFNLNSTYDMGISANGNLTVDGADTVIDITKSTEGLESKNIMTINNGTIDIIASDDGLNATGGNNGLDGGGGLGGRPESNNGEMPDGFQPPTDRQNEGGKQNRPGRDWNNGEMPATPDFKNGERPTPQDFTNGENIPKDNGFHGGGMMGGNQKECLIINGGNIEITAEDDCLDSNGSLTVNGGTIKAIRENGTFSGNFSVFDPDGALNINEGANIIIAGSGGSLTTAENSISIYCETTHNSNETITLKDSSGNVVLEYTPKAEFSAVLVSSPILEIGKKYTVSIGDEDNEVTLSEQKTVIGTQNVGGGMMGGFGGRPR